MGWGTIIGGGTKGLYTLALDYGAAKRNQWVSSIDGWIAQLNAQIAATEADILAAEAKTKAAEERLNALITQLSSGGSGESGAAAAMAQMEGATLAFARAKAAEDAVRIPRAQKIAERKDLASRKAYLESAVVQETKQAWCVDFTQNASGYVATIEVPGENKSILIAPGGRSPLPTDGTLAARELMTPEQVFLNAALLPGWQKWRPTYRKGTLVTVNQDANLATVSLDPATSSANQLGVNQSSSLSNVPVTYMDCHAAVFEAGDRVVVAFDGQDWTRPRVIGFVDNPKSCQRISVYRYVDNVLVYSEQFYPGDTVPAYTAPSAIVGQPGKPPISRPFAGWDDGTNTMVHPEFVVELPNLIYIFRAEYPNIAIDDIWHITETYEPPNAYFRVDVDEDTFYYEASSTFSGVLYVENFSESNPHPTFGFASLDLPGWSGPYEVVGETLPPETTMMSSMPGGPSITDYIPTEYAKGGVNSNGWTVANNMEAFSVSRTLMILQPVTITATPPP